MVRSTKVLGSSGYRADLCVLVAGGTAPPLLQEERVAGSLLLWLGPRAQGQEFGVTAHA